jgi:hypothetical protein
MISLGRGAAYGSTSCFLLLLLFFVWSETEYLGPLHLPRMTDESNGASGGSRINRGNKQSEETCASDALFTTNLTWTEPGTPPSEVGEYLLEFWHGL